MTYSWGKPKEVVAQRFLKSQLPGMFKKELIIGTDEICLVEKDGKVINEFNQGKHTVSSLFGGDFKDIVLIDISNKGLTRKISNLNTKDNSVASCELDMQFSVYSPEKFVRNYMKSKNLVVLEDIFVDMQMQILTKVLQPEVASKNITELYGNIKLTDSITSAFEFEMKKILVEWGIELTGLDIVWEFPEDYIQELKEKSLIEERGRLRETEHQEELKEVKREKETESMQAEDTFEKTKSDLESEVVRKEVDFEIKRKESAEDTEEALEALKLKDIMDKQNTLKKKRDLE